VFDKWDQNLEAIADMHGRLTMCVVRILARCARRARPRRVGSLAFGVMIVCNPGVAAPRETSAASRCRVARMLRHRGDRTFLEACGAPELFRPKRACPNRGAAGAGAATCARREDLARSRDDGPRRDAGITGRPSGTARASRCSPAPTTRSTSRFARANALRVRDDRERRATIHARAATGTEAAIGAR